MRRTPTTVPTDARTNDATSGPAENPFVARLRDVGASHVALVGGKGANLGELTRLDGVRVPAGFCVTTHAFRASVQRALSVVEQIERLAAADDPDEIRTTAAALRDELAVVELADGVATAITDALGELDPEAVWAVRSSATAEDLPGSSFAGQHDTYLGVVGTPAVLEHVRRCWASLFTDRAVAYRRRHGIDHRGADMAVVVQRMIDADASGVVFTADPVTSNRTVAMVEAVRGPGESLVSGRATPDTWTVRDERVMASSTADPARPAVLTEPQVLRIVAIARRIEAHFGAPQDIEWCLAGGGDQAELHVVQSRPITTLFPIPATSDGARHVFVSVGHQQMMTDPMKPLGLSVFRLTAGRPMYEAAGRLFVDVAAALASPEARTAMVEGLTRSDPLIGDALRAVIDRDDTLPPAPDGIPAAPALAGPPPSAELDPSLVTRLVERTEASLAALRVEIRRHHGPDLFEFILADVEEQKRSMFDAQNMEALMAGIGAMWWLDGHLRTWLGEVNAADALTRSVPGNVTSEMGLALLDVADAIRPHAEVVALLERVGPGDDGFLDELDGLPGGDAARDAIEVWLDRYGMRCVGEIDITRPRWREQPASLVPLILGNVRNFEPGERECRFERGREEAAAATADLLARLRALPDGEARAEETQRMIERLRSFIGYREHPKYGIVCRYFEYKQAILAEADRLVEAGVLEHREQVFHLTFDELHDVVRSGQVDAGLLRARELAFASYAAMTPPRVITSDGEVITGAYRREDVPEGALVGLPVSAGTVEGRARVLADIADADLAPGDILVTTHTDPSWTPLFVSIAALVTEVGGHMTHGAVIAREYGLPAVVGVEHATELIRDGQRIRVQGAAGYIELLE